MTIEQLKEKIAQAEKDILAIVKDVESCGVVVKGIKRESYLVRFGGDSGNVIKLEVVV